MVAADIGAQIDTGEIIPAKFFFERRFAELMSEGFFQQLDVVLLGMQDAEIAALGVDQLARVDGHADKALRMLFLAADVLQPDAE